MISEPYNNEEEEKLVGEVLKPAVNDRKELLTRLDAAAAKLEQIKADLQRCNEKNH